MLSTHNFPQPGEKDCEMCFSLPPGQAARHRTNKITRGDAMGLVPDNQVTLQEKETSQSSLVFGSNLSITFSNRPLISWTRSHFLIVIV